ncbi:MAG: hydroxyisourate hydrolase [Methylotenera sp.]|nr:hydroxyisourate hydrolase [Oligoflexia bacterium]
MISTHILDTSAGSPAEGVAVRLEIQSGAAAPVSSLNSSAWTEVSSGVTNADGRFVFADSGAAGTYRIHFEVQPYFVHQKKEAFFPTVSVVFRVENTQRKYHVPLLLNPYGYSTYRGS